MIEIEGLSKTYGVGPRATHALSGVDLAIGPGMFGLLGPNGAGKTTLMRIVAGIARPTRGTVRVAGHDLSTETGRRRAKAILGYLPQELSMYPEMSAAQFVDYMGVLKGVADARARRRRVEEVLAMVGLSEVAGRRIKGFSGGMKRRVGIAQALVNDPRLLVVDEPTAGLDPEERIRFRNLLVGLAGTRTVVLSTHIVDDIGQTCRDLAVLGRGALLFRGGPVELSRIAEGHVWSATRTRLDEPPPGTTIVSMLHLPEGVEVRYVGPSSADARPVPPSLEDGYVRLMATTRAPLADRERSA